MDKNSKVTGIRIIGGIVFLFGSLSTISSIFLPNLPGLIAGIVMVGFGASMFITAKATASHTANQEGKPPSNPNQKPIESEYLAKEIQNLADMKEKGLIDEEEFKKLKSKLLK